MVASGISPITLAIVKAAAKQSHDKHFKKFPEEGVDDLVQIGLLAAMKAHQTYRFEGGTAYSTWINRAIQMDWVDRARALERRSAWHKERGLRTDADTLNDTLSDIDSSPVTLPEKLRAVYLLAKRNPPKTTKCRQGWVRNRARHIAIAWLTKQSTMSNRALEDMLRDRRDLWTMLEMQTPPNYRMIHRARKFVTIFGESTLFF